MLGDVSVTLVRMHRGLYGGMPMTVDENELALRVLALEQRIEAYRRLHREELDELAAELERLRAALVQRGLEPRRTSTHQAG